MISRSGQLQITSFSCVPRAHLTLGLAAFRRRMIQTFLSQDVMAEV